MIEHARSPIKSPAIWFAIAVGLLLRFRPMAVEFWSLLYAVALVAAYIGGIYADVRRQP